MSNLSHTHLFVSGLFLASIFSMDIWISAILACILIILWGNFILPLAVALFVDISFIDVRVLQNAYGFNITIYTLILIVLLIPLRRFLKF